MRYACVALPCLLHEQEPAQGHGGLFTSLALLSLPATLRQLPGRLDCLNDHGHCNCSLARHGFRHRFTPSG